MKTKWLVNTLSLAVLAANATHVSAQEEADSLIGLEEVIVTAQRRSESLQDAAIAIDAVSTDQIDRAGLDSADGLAQLSPSLGIAASGGAIRSIFIRGVGSLTTNALLDAAVAQNYDGVYLGRPSAASSLSIFDMERVEILKGPQGTLYGRNATGGVINYIPIRPVIGENTGYVQAEVGNFSRVGLQGAANLALTENVALRLAGASLDRDGYADDGSRDSDLLSFRAQLLAELSDDLSLRFAVDHSEAGGTGNTGGDVLGVFNASAAAGPLTDFTPATEFTSNTLDTGPTSAEANAVRAEIGRRDVSSAEVGQDLEYSGILAELNYDTDAGTLTVISAYRDSTEDYALVGPGFSAAPTLQEQEQLSLEARFATDFDGPLNGIFGAFYYDDEISFDGTFSQDTVAPVQNYDTNNSSWALFASGAIELSDTFRINLGGRYTEDEKDVTGTNLTFVAPGFQLPSVRTPDGIYAAVGVPGATIDDFVPIAPGAPSILPGASTTLLAVAIDILTPGIAEFSDDAFTYRVGVEWDAAEDSLIYATYETGYRSGGVDINPATPTYESESISSITIGSKNRFFDNRLQLNLEAFYWEYEDQQISYFALDGGGAPSFQTANGNSTIQGLDVDVQFAAGQYTTLGAKMQYLDSVIDEAEFFSAIIDGQATGRYGCPETRAEGGNQFYECAGSPLLYSPEYSFDFNLEQVIPLGEYELISNLDVIYRDEQNTDFSQVREVLADSHTLVDLTLTFAAEDWSVSVFGRNLGDERYNGSSNLSAYGMAFGLPNPPRTYGIRFRADF